MTFSSQVQYMREVVFGEYFVYLLFTGDVAFFENIVGCVFNISPTVPTSRPPSFTQKMLRATCRTTGKS